MFSKQTAFLVAAALVASPVAAADNAETNTNASQKAENGKSKTYCIAERTTGTRMVSKVCKTKAEWDKDGIDIAAETPKK
jgi:hypothetical protein